MADKAISELVSAEQITATDMFVLEQNGTAKKLTGQVLLNWLTAAADGHGGIQSYDLLKTEGLVKTYRFTLADQSYMDIQVTDGRGINSVTKTGTSGLVDTYRISYNDGSTGTFTVTNGAKGDKGDNAYLWVKYASQQPTASSHSFGDLPDDWIGVYWGTSATAPTDWQQYKWFKIKGEKGDTGEPATLVSSVITYQTGTSGTVIPSGSWSENIPTVPQGQFLWTREVTQFNTGEPITKYSVSRFGMDGSGAVSTVAGVSPDASGNVPLSADNIKALPIAGGTMQGSINMNGQKLNGLNAPTDNDEAATMGVVKEITDRKVSMELLWQNGDATSEFMGQTIPLNLSEYNLVAIYSRAPYAMQFVFKGLDSSLVGLSHEQSTTNYVACRSRTVSVSDTGITFGNGIEKKLTDKVLTTTNSVAKPIYIYGVKGVSK